MEKISKKSLVLWRVRLTLASAVGMSLVTILLKRYPILQDTATTAILAVFLFFFLIYCPVRYQTVRYAATADGITIRSGVFWRHERYVLKERIQCIAFVSSPLSRLLGLCDAEILASGAKVRIPSLDKHRAEALETLYAV